MDIIALRCDYPIYRISGILLNMELKGVVRPLPGKLFEAIWMKTTADSQIMVILICESVVILNR
jgi:hypothetical protein